MKRKSVVVAVAVVVVIVVAVWGYAGSIPYLSPSLHGEQFLQVSDSSMQPTIKLGAMVVYDEVPFSELTVEDIIIFKRPTDDALVVARITLITPDGLQTKGDDNFDPHEWIITADMYIGKIIRIDNPS